MLLELRHVGKQFVGVKAVDDMSLTVEEGSIVGLIGPNGAGKTTIINLITGIFRPSSGDILFRGSSLVGKKPYQIARDGIGRTFQQIRLFDHLDVLDNVLIGMDPQLTSGYGATILSLPSVRNEEAARKEQALALLAADGGGLLKSAHRRPSELPYADKRRLEIIRALANKPSLLLLDEPAAGMAPQEIHSLIEDLQQVRKNGTTILLIEHKMRLIEGATDKVIVVDYGRKIAEGVFAEVRRDKRVIEAYLGRNYAVADAVAS
jgi:ABC-type branched-subunit amino acid transport system ATPase component